VKKLKNVLLKTITYSQVFVSTSQDTEKWNSSPTRVYNSICLVYGNYRQYYEFPFFYEWNTL